MANERRIGDLKPFQELADEIQKRVDDDREFRGDADPVVRALTSIRRRLDQALEAAQSAQLTLTIEEYAERECISTAAAYKRFQAGAIPGAEKRHGQGIVIPADYAVRKAS